MANKISLFGSQIIAPLSDLNYFATYDTDVARQSSNVARLLFNGSAIVPAPPNSVKIFLPPISSFDDNFNFEFLLVDSSGSVGAGLQYLLVPNQADGDRINEATGLLYGMTTTDGTAYLQIIDKNKWKATGGAVVPIVVACYGGAVTIPATNNFSVAPNITTFTINAAPVVLPTPISILNTNAIVETLNDLGVFVNSARATQIGNPSTLASTYTLQIYGVDQTVPTVFNNFILDTTPPSTVAFAPIACP